MANTLDPRNYQKYGVPFYGAGWVPYKYIKPDEPKSPEKEGKKDSDDDSPSLEPQPSAPRDYVVLIGGDGEGRSGVPNAVVLSHFDFESYALSDQPVFKLNLGADLPHRMAIHPRKDGIICAFENSCRLYEWDEVDSSEVHQVGLKKSKKVLPQLENIGQQLVLSFNNDGTIFAMGSEDGSLRVFKWPLMDIIFKEDKAHASIKDLAFSPDGNFLASMGEVSPVRVCDLSKPTTVFTMPKEKGLYDEMFVGCRFSQISDKQVLYVAVVTEWGTNVITWDTNLWKKMRTIPITSDSAKAIDVSADGKHLAIGTSQGDILIVNSANSQVHMKVNKAHLGFVTTLSFSHDSRVLLSSSMDSSARVTLVEAKQRGKVLTANPRMLTLRSCDGDTFRIEESAANQSLTIKHMIEQDVGKEDIPLQNVTGTTLNYVVLYCRQHANTRADPEDLNEWDNGFLETVGTDALFDLLLAANYLDIKSLLDLTCQAVANKIKGRSPLDISRNLDIWKKLPPHEKEAILKDQEDRDNLQ